MAKIAIMNSSKEVTDMIREVFREAGFETIDIFTYKFKNGEIDFEEFVNQNKPNVILYDIAIPYKENFELFNSLLEKNDDNKIPFVVTTTNKYALDKIVGKTQAFELIGKPYDLDELLKLVKKVADL